MKKIFYFILLICSFSTNYSIAQTHNPTVSPPDSAILDTVIKYQVSLLTCGAGDDLYTAFGHSAVRIKNLKSGKDLVYNYGMFNYSDPNFYGKFTLGKLDYFIGKSTYSDFLSEYQYDKRSVKEQVLALTNEQTNSINSYLENNILPQNKYYKYDFIHDNCATRIRDMFESVLGVNFRWGDVLGAKKVSYRGIINEYLINEPWARLGINILLGSNIDSLMTNKSSMFLPDFLYQNMNTAKIANKSIVGKDSTILEGAPRENIPNMPLYVNIGVLILTILLFNIKALTPVRQIWIRLILIITGLLGFLILFMWLLTDHQACDNNYNILWALPTNFLLAFLNFKNKNWVKLYALAAISLLMVALIISIIGIQVFPLVELFPIFIVLMLVFVALYKLAIPASTKTTT